MSPQEALARFIDHREIFHDEMLGLMRKIMGGEVSPTLIAALVIGLRVKKETIGEIAAAAQVMREFATRVPVPADARLVDTCGTGVDAAHTFNISTAAMFVAAAAGARVAKHGGRSVSSSSGSADVLEALGVNIMLTPEQVARSIAETGMGFMFAPSHHAAMKLRAIARELTISAPAIYNYFPDRDALVTALIIDAYISFGDSHLEARDSLPEKNIKERLNAIGMAYRAWALTHPQRYQLIFGTPIPGYEAPMMEVLPSAARSLSALVSVVEQLRVSGKLNVTSFPEVKEEYKDGFDVWKTYGGNVEILSLSVAMIIWSRVHGIVSLEIARTRRSA